MSNNIERFKIYGAVYVFLVKDGKIFLIRRANTGWQDGKYNLPAGHIEENETATIAALREAFEEAGVKIKPEDLRFAHIMHRLNPEKDRVYADYFFIADKYEGEPRLMEKDKADEVGWFPLYQLPDNIIPYLKEAIENYHKGIPFASTGW